MTNKNKKSQIFDHKHMKKKIESFCNFFTIIKTMLSKLKFYLRHPHIGFVFKSCIVKPHSPIVVNNHAINNNVINISSLHGTTNTVNMAI